jgi:hypothetical protein
MDAIMEFMGNTWTMVGMGVILLALVGFLVYRLVFAKKGED